MQLDSRGTDSETAKGCLSFLDYEKQNRRGKESKWGGGAQGRTHLGPPPKLLVPNFTDNLLLKRPLKETPSSFIVLQTQFSTELLDPKSDTIEVSGKAPSEINEVWVEHERGKGKESKGHYCKTQIKYSCNVHIIKVHTNYATHDNLHLPSQNTQNILPDQ